MPEYVAPGVYVEEYGSTPKTIPGVSTSIDDATLPCVPACGPLARPNFFTGRLLDAAALAAEQNYQREMHRRHNRALHGYGVVSGLDVHIDASGSESQIAVAPGYAIDPCGNEIALCESIKLRLPADLDEAFISLRQWERACDPASGPDGPRPAFIEDACIVAIAAHVPATAITLARVANEASGWSIDANFVVPRARSTADQEEWGG